MVKQLKIFNIKNKIEICNYKYIIRIQKIREKNKIFIK